MHCKQVALVLFGTLSVAMATFEIAITSGAAVTTLSPGLVTLGALGIGALAIVKKGLILNALANRRSSGGRSSGRRWGRDVSNTIYQTPVEMESYFDAIAQSDVADCGKLLVCSAMAKTEGTLTSEEKAITELFDDLEYINPYSGHGEFQLAAYAGKFKQPEICVARYSRCPVAVEELGKLLKIQQS